MSRPRSGLGVATLLLCCALCACSKPPSHDECEALLDHYVELLVKADPDFGACRERVSRSALECALNAPNADLLEQCLL
jgi:hypothetical protein